MQIQNNYTIPENILSIILTDQTLSLMGKTEYIFWATDDYEYNGEGYKYKNQILPKLISGENENIIIPRFQKNKNIQSNRARQKGEVYTPSFICNMMINQLDNGWFDRDVFTKETDNADGSKSWTPIGEKIIFPPGKTWEDYIKLRVLEPTCGEGAFLVSRYDNTSGEFLPIERRYGMIDRKLRVVNENAYGPIEWLKWTIKAYQHTFGYEWLGDSLFLTRKSLLFTFIDYFINKYDSYPPEEILSHIAEIISWNIIQMDGIKGVIPNSCHHTEKPSKNGNDPVCEGCRNDLPLKHNGIYCMIRDWENNVVYPFAATSST